MTLELGWEAKLTCVVVDRRIVVVWFLVDQGPRNFGNVPGQFGRLGLRNASHNLSLEIVADPTCQDE